MMDAWPLIYRPICKVCCESGENAEKVDLSMFEDYTFNTYTIAVSGKEAP